MRIIEIKKFHEDYLSAVNSLLPQLSPFANPLAKNDLKKIIESSTTRLLVAEDNKQVLGILTLVLFKIPTGTRAWIEDVVVDCDARGIGIGKLLVEHALKLAKGLGAETIDLTSHPSRKAANRLYKKIGFGIRETNVYRYNI